MPSVHDGFSRVLPHASRSHQVKGRLNDAAVQNINGARGFQRLPPHARPMVQNLQTILTVTVNDARSGNAIRVFHFRIQFNSVTLFRQVFTQYSHPHDMPKSLAHHAMMLRSPGHGLVHKSTPSLVQRAEGSFQEKRIAAHEPPFQVSLIKLFAERRNTKGPFPPVHLFLKYSFRNRKGWIMKFLPTSPDEFARPLGKSLDLELRSSRGVPMPFAQSTTTRAACLKRRPWGS